MRLHYIFSNEYHPFSKSKDITTLRKQGHALVNLSERTFINDHPGSSKRHISSINHYEESTAVYWKTYSPRCDGYVSPFS